jgi:opacity protein-like surface antigen
MSVRAGRVLATFLLVLACAPAHAQIVTAETETLAFDRPEAWGMKYYTSIAIMTSVGAPETRRPGELALGFEGGLVPQLSDAERRIGFDGTKLEDVNKTHFFGRIRAGVGLGAGFALDLGYTPPIDHNGAKPNLFAAAIGRPFQLAPSWRLGLRSYGQVGNIKGDITCSAKEAAAGNDPDLNPYQCVEPSSDVSRQKTLGLEMTVGYDSGGALKPYIGVMATYMDLEFQVNALYGGGQIEDHNLQLTSGTTVAATAGLSYAPSPRWRINGELFYTWLSIVRPPATSAANEGLFNARLYVSYRVR